MLPVPPGSGAFTPAVLPDQAEAKETQVPAHAELAWLLNCITPVGRLNRMTTWKVRCRVLDGAGERLTEARLGRPNWQSCAMPARRSTLTTRCSILDCWHTPSCKQPTSCSTSEHDILGHSNGPDACSAELHMSQLERISCSTSN